ncbi:MAG: hypothetical protein ACR2L2_20320 [Acidobacteriota bacterium]
MKSRHFATILDAAVNLPARGIRHTAYGIRLRSCRAEPRPVAWFIWRLATFS